MLGKDQVIATLRNHRDYLATEFGVRRIGLFGSFASDQAGPSSDIDLVVDFEKPVGFQFLELVDYLEGIFDRDVEVLTPAGIENIRLKDVADRIAESIIYV